MRKGGLPKEEDGYFWGQKFGDLHLSSEWGGKKEERNQGKKGDIKEDAYKGMIISGWDAKRKRRKGMGCFAGSRRLQKGLHTFFKTC